MKTKHLPILLFVVTYSFNVNKTPNTDFFKTIAILGSNYIALFLFVN